MKSILSMRNIVKKFSNVEVLHSVNLDLWGGEALALAGENGAGKSTLMKILMGIEQPTSGEIYLYGERVDVENPAKALKLGIAMIHQELAPIPEMTVEENMFIGREINRLGLVNSKEQFWQTRDWLQKLNINISPRKKMRELSVSQTQMIEIVKAISYNSKILIMDEPTSAITEKEVFQLFDLLKRLKEDGISIIYISHKLHELAHIADRIQVMRDGNTISVSSMADKKEEDIVIDMVGREISHIYPKVKNKIGQPVLQVERLTQKGEFENINFSLHAGEKLGIAGLMGSGRTQLMEAIFGVSAPDSGRVLVDGQLLHSKNIADSIKRGIALVPEDRKLFGLNLQMSVIENITMCIDSLIAKYIFINNEVGKKLTKSMVGKISIKIRSIQQKVSNLSGGNQQKVVLAKWLLTEPSILLLDEPTRGIDVGAKAEIYELINSQVLLGKAVIIVSSEMQELIGIADRILVMCQGKLTGELIGTEITEENIMAYASPQKNASIKLHIGKESK